MLSGGAQPLLPRCQPAEEGRMGTKVGQPLCRPACPTELSHSWSGAQRGTSGMRPAHGCREVHPGSQAPAGAMPSPCWPRGAGHAGASGCVGEWLTLALRGKMWTPHVCDPRRSMSSSSGGRCPCGVKGTRPVPVPSAETLQALPRACPAECLTASCCISHPYVRLGLGRG